jgi:Flp pilus assembly protein TadD
MPSRCCAAPWRSTRQVLGAGHTKVAKIRGSLAAALVALGRAVEAIAVVEPALTACPNDPPLRVAQARMVMAEALWATGERARAVQQARSAAVSFRVATPPATAELAAASAWIAAHLLP